MFPELPLTGDSLEAQQAALLQQQEENLKHLRERSMLLTGCDNTKI